MDALLFSVHHLCECAQAVGLYLCSTGLRGPHCEHTWAVGLYLCSALFMLHHYEHSSIAGLHLCSAGLWSLRYEHPDSGSVIIHSASAAFLRSEVLFLLFIFSWVSALWREQTLLTQEKGGEQISIEQQAVP